MNFDVNRNGDAFQAPEEESLVSLPQVPANHEMPVQVRPMDNETIPDQAMVVEALRNMEIDFSSEGYEKILPLDPDRFYIVTKNGNPINNSEILGHLGKYFKKGGLLLLNRKDEAKGYTLEDLKSMRDGITRLIEMLEKTNRVAYNRFDIIKGSIAP